EGENVVPPSMTPRWMTIEKLVAELAGIRPSPPAEPSRAESEDLSEETLDAALGGATKAITSLLENRADDDSVVRDAWHAIACAQDAIGRLRETIARSRALRERAQRLQDESLRLRQRAAGRLLVRRSSGD